MKTDLREELEIPEGASIKIEGGVFVVKGEKGELQKKLDNPSIVSRVIGNKIVFEAKKATQRQKKLVKAYLAHLRNMIRGVAQGHSYKLKICSGHFPMSVGVKGNMFEIKNFIGETVPRTMTIPEGISVKIEGQFILVEGIGKELAGQTAALIEKLTKRPGYDKRIFQDGIFIIEKDGKPVHK
ncbi:50S ribosomal protein L6 [Candidatus Woesearchaeota archaeon]|nr:50S ribosomal protein L6 [Candidatus Woesearchaeota archaeon]